MRPHYIVCCATGMYENDKPNMISWCNRDLSREFHFVDPTHAILNGKQQGSLVLCHECADFIIDILNEQLILSKSCCGINDNEKL